MSQGESYPIKTSPVGKQTGWTGEMKDVLYLLKWAYLNCIKFKVFDVTCNSSWILNAISKIEDKCVSII